jgi:hypothetical protein
MIKPTFSSSKRTRKRNAQHKESHLGHQTSKPGPFKSTMNCRKYPKLNKYMCSSRSSPVVQKKQYKVHADADALRHIRRPKFANLELRQRTAEKKDKVK